MVHKTIQKQEQQTKIYQSSNNNDSENASTSNTRSRRKEIQVEKVIWCKGERAVTKINPEDQGRSLIGDKVVESILPQE